VPLARLELALLSKRDFEWDETFLSP